MLLAIATVTVIIDQLSKHWALLALNDGRTLPILGDWLSLHLVHNPGAAFSFLDNATWVFTLIATAFVVAFPFFLRSVSSRVVLVSAALVWGGAIGNLIDRLFRDPGFPQGHVVDFIQYSDWFIGNVADIALVAGFAVWGIYELLSPSSPNATTHTVQTISEEKP
ncbi:signal peptidase II [Arcanobacterium phocisimile]|uniref:Lipoprotein signal peptidase n=1 Tax=Arcanobacterium phocisimile TaxID=1302235 RepID=A0ABX7IJV0_9ACTO|nr:signal peptidase II [Arcanobacterium phocisimile]